MQLFFTRLLCFSVSMMLFGCATFKDDSSSLRQESSPETKVVAPARGPIDDKAIASIPGTAPADTTSALAQQRTGPAAEVPEKSFDFGIMNEDKNYSHAFIIKNVGTSELTIKKVIRG